MCRLQVRPSRWRRPIAAGGHRRGSPLTMNDDTDDEIADTEIRTPRVEPESVDEGKDVVCADGRTIGMVTRVRGDTLYVDPDTSLSDRLERRSTGTVPGGRTSRSGPRSSSGSAVSSSSRSDATATSTQTGSSDWRPAFGSAGGRSAAGGQHRSSAASHPRRRRCPLQNARHSWCERRLDARRNPRLKGPNRPFSGRGGCSESPGRSRSKPSSLRRVRASGACSRRRGRPRRRTPARGRSRASWPRR